MKQCCSLAPAFAGSSQAAASVSACFGVLSLFVLLHLLPCLCPPRRGLTDPVALRGGRESDDRRQTEAASASWAPLARTTVGAALALSSRSRQTLGDDRLRRGVDQVVEEGAIA